MFVQRVFNSSRVSGKRQPTVVSSLNVTFLEGRKKGAKLGLRQTLKNIVCEGDNPCFHPLFPLRGTSSLTVPKGDAVSHNPAKPLSIIKRPLCETFKFCS